jgi:Ca2+-binding RTX toxin-like protein
LLALRAAVNAAVLASGLAFRGLYVKGHEGSDTIDLAELDVRAIVNAGIGDDEVTGGSDSDLILGGSGADDIFGGDGRDLLVGGRDGDELDGGAADDIAIGGEPRLEVDALDGALAEWNAAGSYAARVDDVLQILVANENVIEDQVVDALTGGAKCRLPLGGYHHAPWPRRARWSRREFHNGRGLRPGGTCLAAG